MQFAARQRGLQQIGRIHRAVGFAGADDRMHLIDEEDVEARRRGHLLQHGLEPLLELAAIFRAGDQRAHVERQELLVLQAFRHVAIDDAQRQALDDRGLADAGLADQHRIVLGPPRQHLDGAADFLVAPDHRIELAVTRRLRQIAGIFLQRVIGVFRRRAVGSAPLAQSLDGGIERLRRDAGIGQDLPGLAVLFEREREQQPFNGDKAVAGLLARLLGGVEHAPERRIEINLPCPAAGHFRPLGKHRLDGGQAPRANCRRRDRSAPRRALPGRRAGLSTDVQGRIAGVPRAARATGQTARNRGCGRCIFRNPCLFPRPIPEPLKALPDHRHWVNIVACCRAKP